MIDTGRPWAKYADRIIEITQDYDLSTRFGWTPKQIEDLPYTKRLQYISLMRGETIAQENKK